VPELDITSFLIVGLCGVLVGLSKTGIPGAGILGVPLMAMVLPARRSVGVLLGILILADLFAAGYYRRAANWYHILRLLPVTFAGIVAGYFALRFVSNRQLRVIIGVIVLVMLAANHLRSRVEGSTDWVSRRWAFAAGIGFMAGIATMMANAAGPVMVIYLLAMRLPKTEFVGTAAWFFFIINWLKVPFSASLDLMTAESIKLDLMVLPFILIGAVAGVLVLKRIPEKVFGIVVQILAAAAAVRLLF